MRKLRGWLRLVGFWPLTWFFQGLWAVARLCTLRGPAARRRAHAVVTRWWARSTLRLLGVRVTVAGTPPTPPFLLAGNHLSYLDVVVYWATLPTCFLAKAEVEAWPIFGRITRSTGNLFVDRSRRSDMRRVVEECSNLLQHGYGLTVFAEGTSTAGAAVLPFQSSLFEAAVRCHVPVHTAAIRYRTGPGDDPPHRAVCWWGEMEFFPHFLNMLRQRRIDARLHFGSTPVEGQDRRQLAAAAHARVAAVFEPMVTAAELGD